MFVLEVRPNEWILLKVAHKKEKSGTTRIQFPNDATPRYVERETFLDIESFLDARYLSKKGAGISENDIEISLDEAAFKKINVFSRRSPKVGLGVFVMNKPFAIIHMVYSLEKPVMYWTGEDEAGSTIVVELIKTYRTINET